MSEGSPSYNGQTVKIMIVDDSAIIRGLYRRLIDEVDDIEIISDASNGQMAIDRLKRTEVDVVVMDIEMPVLDGVSALPGMLEVQPDVQIVMSSTLTERNAEIALKAMEAGARDYIQKPTTKGDIAVDGHFRLDLLNKIRQLGKARHAAQGSLRSVTTERPVGQNDSSKEDRWRGVSTRGKDAINVTLRKPGRGKPRVMVVGSSTGGPQALQEFFRHIDASFPLPILVVQHMPPKFTTILCNHIERVTGWSCREGVTGDSVLPGRILLAPGGYHMIIRPGTPPMIELNEDPPENFCRPAVDPLFRSAAAAYGGSTLGVILTGMGNDGTRGGRVIVENGGTVIAQDEESSVVWGMPGSAAAAELCSAIMPLKDLAGKATGLARGIAA